MPHVDRLRTLIAALESDTGDHAILREALTLLQSQLAAHETRADDLRRHTERLDLALDAAAVGIWDWNLATGCITWNHHHARIFGLQPGDFDGHYSAFEKQIHPDDREKVAAWVGEAIAHKTPYDHEYRIVRPDGEVRWVHGRGRCSYDAAGCPARVTGTLIDITDRVLSREDEASAALRRTEADLRKNLAELQAVFDAVPVGIAISDDPACQSFRVNTTFASIVRMHPGRIGTKACAPGERPDHFQTFRDGKPLPADQLPMEQAAATGAPVRNASVDLLFTTGDVVSIFGNAVPLFNDDGSVRGVVGAFLDDSERKRTAEELQHARQDALDASAAKDRFLAVLSHELRNPLTPILNAAQVLEADTALGPRQRDLVTLLRRNAELEARLIDDLLDLTRLERGKIQLDVATTDLHEQAEFAAAMFEPDARTKNITLTLDLDAQRHHVQGDRSRLLQILANLIKNAVKFSPIGGAVRIASRNAGDRIEIAIADSGIGIPGDLLPRLFQPFEQGGAGVTRQFGGLGLGLAISKGLVDMHGGSLRAESPGKGLGATFTVSFPAVDPPRLVPSAPIARHDEPAPGSCRVLLVEDHADTARLMKTVLLGFGCDVTTAATVEAACAALELNAFDLLLCDIGLPDGAGTDVMATAARLQPDLHGIALSGYGMPEDIELSKRAGFLAHLTKPVDLDALQHLVLAHWHAPPAP